MTLFHFGVALLFASTVGTPVLPSHYNFRLPHSFTILSVHLLRIPTVCHESLQYLVLPFELISQLTAVLLQIDRSSDGIVC